MDAKRRVRYPSERMIGTQRVIPNRVAAIAFVLLLSLSCGGKTNDSNEAGNGGTSSSLPPVGGAQGVGGVSVGGTSGGSEGTSTMDTCAGLERDYCVKYCLNESNLVLEPTCANGVWTCSDWVLASSCPPQSCGRTPDACCNRTTGELTLNLCGGNGYRGTCADETEATYFPWCVPLPYSGCGGLDGRPCAAPAMYCREKNVDEILCACNVSDSTWHCQTWYTI
jgi:hypothetical protein